MDHRLSSGNEGKAPPLFGVCPEDTGQEAPRLPGFTAEAVCQQHRLIAQLPALLCRRRAQLPDTAGDLGAHIVQFLWRLLSQQKPGLRRQTQTVFLRCGLRLGTGREIRIGGSAGNHIQRIAQDIAEDDTEYPGRGTEPGKPPAFDLAQPLADRIDLHNVRPAPHRRRGAFQRGHCRRRRAGTPRCPSPPVPAPAPAPCRWLRSCFHPARDARPHSRQRRGYRPSHGRIW